MAAPAQAWRHERGCGDGPNWRLGLLVARETIACLAESQFKVLSYSAGGVEAET